MNILGLGFCLLFLAAMFLVNIVLPVFLVVKLAQWAWRWHKTGEPPWRAAPVVAAHAAAPAADAGLAGALERSRAEAAAARAEAASAKAEAAALKEAAALDRRRSERFAALKTGGNVNRVALLYYVEDALKAGMAPAAVAAALRAKKWPEEEILAVLPDAAGAGGSPA